MTDKGGATAVTICGQTYHLRGNENADYLADLASFVDRKINRLFYIGRCAIDALEAWYHRLVDQGLEVFIGFLGGWILDHRIRRKTYQRDIDVVRD